MRNEAAAKKAKTERARLGKNRTQQSQRGQSACRKFIIKRGRKFPEVDCGCVMTDQHKTNKNTPVSPAGKPPRSSAAAGARISMSAVLAKARELGVGQESLDNAMDEDDPRTAVVSDSNSILPLFLKPSGLLLYMYEVCDCHGVCVCVCS